MRLAACAWVAVLAATSRGEIEIGSPGFLSSKVAPDGSLVEPWGSVSLRLLGPAGAIIEQRRQDEPMPCAITLSDAGQVRLTQTAYRAPIWPEGCDVIEAAVENRGDQPVEAQLELALPEKMLIGETLGMIGGRPSLALPRALCSAREERDWGFMGGATALRGWGKPSKPCDPTFKNIAAGLGGVPIKYKFSTDVGGTMTVVLGFCESHHEMTNQRVMLATVEGAPPLSIDPIARWGRHVPGVVRFVAKDADRDGRIIVAVAPDALTSDRNPILNAIWLFAPSMVPDDATIIAGTASPSALKYVDVGGESDQSLYPPGNLKYTIPLLPRETRSLVLCARCPGAKSVPDPATSAWTSSSLRRAATEVWHDRWDKPPASTAKAQTN